MVTNMSGSVCAASICAASITRVMQSCRRLSIRIVCLLCLLFGHTYGRNGRSTYVEGLDFCGGRWFIRGWALKELMKLEVDVFFDKKWNEIGTQSYLHGMLSSVTGI